MKHSALFALLAATLFTGCAANRPYRLAGVGGDLYEKKYPGQKLPFEDNAPGRPYRLSFVEFDEKGDFWDRRQLGNAAGRIKRSPKPVLLVIFIHGWHHNAADRSPGERGDVETFRCLLSQIALSESTRAMQVHGVYLGWRGRLVQGPLDYLTFLGRKAAATRIAGTPVTETIFETIRQARRAHPGAAKCVVIGHSFGALVLEKAMAQAVAGSVLAQDAQRSGGSFNAPADLVLLVNSAAESIYSKELSDMFARIGHRGHIDENRPLFLSLTSETDSATSGWFPAGTALPNLFARRHYTWGDRYGASSHNVSQHHYLTRTPGHQPLLFTHRICPAVAPSRTVAPATTAKPTPDACLHPNPAFDENLQHPRGLTFATSSGAAETPYDWWKIHRRQDAVRTPYWIMQVPKKIIDGHSPIFTPAGRAMMAALFRITNPKTQPGPRQMRLD